MNFMDILSGGKLEQLEADAKAFLANSEKIAAIIVGTGENPISIIEAIVGNFATLTAELADVKQLVLDVHALVSNQTAATPPAAPTPPTGVGSLQMVATATQALADAVKVTPPVASPAPLPFTPADPFAPKPLAHVAQVVEPHGGA